MNLSRYQCGNTVRNTQWCPLRVGVISRVHGCARRWATAQLASTLSALTALIPGRPTARGDGEASSFGSIGKAQMRWPWHGSTAGAAPSGQGAASDAASASGAPHVGENDVGQHMKAAGSTAYLWQAVPSFARWLWRPWDTGGAQHESADAATVCHNLRNNAPGCNALMAYDCKNGIERVRPSVLGT